MFYSKTHRLIKDREKLFVSIIEEKESTIIVGEDAQAGIDEYGFVWIELNAEGGMGNAE